MIFYDLAVKFNPLNCIKAYLAASPLTSHDHKPLVQTSPANRGQWGLHATLKPREYVYRSIIGDVSVISVAPFSSNHYQEEAELSVTKLTCFIHVYPHFLTREERDTKSFAGSGSSSGRRESQESEAGVRGLGLQGFDLFPPKRWPWPQELIHTRASAASRSVYSRPEEPLLIPLEIDCSLSCLLLLEEDPHWAI